MSTPTPAAAPKTKNEALTGIKNAVLGVFNDLTTLEVASFTGTVTIPEDADTANKVFKAIEDNLTSGTLVAYSKFELDGDSMNYTNSSLGEDKKYLLEAHSTLVEGSQKSRKDFFEFILKAVGVTVDDATA